MRHDFVTKECHAWLKVPVLNDKVSGQGVDAYGLMIYAYLLHVARNKKGASQRELRTRLGIDGRPVKRALRSLAVLGLARYHSRKWWAEDPGNAAELFKWLRKPVHTKGIGDKLCYVPTHLPNQDAKDQGITLITSLLYWKLLEWAEPVEGTGGQGAIDPRLSTSKGRRRGLSIRYLVRAMKCDPKTIRKALTTLERLKLIRRVPLGNRYFAVGIFVNKDHCRLWRTEWHATRGASVAELFDAPSACEPQLALTPDRARFLLQAGIPGGMHSELLSLSDKASLEHWEWTDLLLKCKRDNDRNLLEHKSDVPHPGRLFRYELEKRVTASGATLVPDRDAHRLLANDELRRLSGSHQSLVDLVSEAISQRSVMLNSGMPIPCLLEWEDVRKIARNSTFKDFKEQFASRIFTHPQPGVSNWLDRWLALQPLPDKRTDGLRSSLGIDSAAAWQEVEAWVAARCDDEHTIRVRTQEIVDAAVTRLTSIDRARSLAAFRSAYRGVIEVVSPAWFDEHPSYPSSVPYWPDELLDELVEHETLHAA